MELGSKLQVEVSAHGGWWKDSNGRTGQVLSPEARKGPLAAVAMVANGFGMNGWELTEVVSQAHSAYHLTFALAYIMEDEDEEQPADSGRVVTYSG